MKNNTIETEDFIEKPTKISKYLIEIILEEKNKYDLLFRSKNFVQSLINKIRIRVWYLNEYINIYNFLKKYQLYQTRKDKPFENIKNLFNELKRIFNVISLNNLLLTYSYLVEKDKSAFIIDKEDKKLLYFKKFYNKEISEEEFKKKYGHYALNPFELSSKRFKEYDECELMNLARYAREFKLSKNIQLDEQIQKNPKKLFPIYFALRQELRCLALLVVNDLRFELLRLAKEKKVKNIFDMEYKDLMKIKQ